MESFQDIKKKLLEQINGQENLCIISHLPVTDNDICLPCKHWYLNSIFRKYFTVKYKYKQYKCHYCGYPFYLHSLEDTCKYIRQDGQQCSKFVYNCSKLCTRHHNLKNKKTEIIQSNCQHMLLCGKNKGLTCTKPIEKDTKYCKIHQKKYSLVTTQN